MFFVMSRFKSSLERRWASWDEQVQGKPLSCKVLYKVSSPNQRNIDTFQLCCACLRLSGARYLLTIKTRRSSKSNAYGRAWVSSPRNHSCAQLCCLSSQDSLSILAWGRSESACTCRPVSSVSAHSSSDPLNTRTDAELLQILQHAHLIPASGTDAAAEAKFALDASIGQEGSSISGGEKQQLALCRVLVKQSKIVILVRARSRRRVMSNAESRMKPHRYVASLAPSSHSPLTSAQNVDLETDARLQQTIRTELASSTLLTIAHRLNTILAYDRVLVMDQGRYAATEDIPPPNALF